MKSKGNDMAKEKVTRKPKKKAVQDKVIFYGSL